MKGHHVRNNVWLLNNDRLFLNHHSPNIKNSCSYLIFVRCYAFTTCSLFIYTAKYSLWLFPLGQYFLIFACGLFHCMLRAFWRKLHTRLDFLVFGCKHLRYKSPMRSTSPNWDGRHDVKLPIHGCWWMERNILWLIPSQTIIIEWIAEKLATQWTSLVSHSDVWRKWIAEACGAECWEKCCTFKM